MKWRIFAPVVLCSRGILPLLLTLAILTHLAAGQSVPGTLTFSRSSSQKIVNGCGVDTNTLSNFVFTDPSNVKHSFTGQASLTSWRGNGTQCLQPTQTRGLDTWSNDGLYFLESQGDNGTQPIEVVTGASGHVNPKFMVIGVTYAPPGPKSTVSYANSTSTGTMVSNSDSFATGFSISVSIMGDTGDDCTKGSVSGIIGFGGGVCVTGTESNSYTQTSATTNSTNVVKKVGLTNQTTGTPDPMNPVNHDYDLVWLWLNPIVSMAYFTDNPKDLQLLGYGYDRADPALEMDIWPVRLGNLNGHFLDANGNSCYAINPACDPEDAGKLARSWISQNPQIWPAGAGPGLTMADLANIARADPWGANPNYSVVILSGSNPPTTTDQRFTVAPAAPVTVDGMQVQGTQVLDYIQAGPGNGSGLTQMYTFENTTTTVASSTNTYSYTQMFGLEEKVQASFFWQSVSADFKETSTMTWTHSHTVATTNTNDSTASTSVTGPPCSTSGPCTTLYTGFPQFQIFQDNMFGGFMFWGIN